jgi:hypothetical protein
MGHSLNERRHDARFIAPVIDGITVTLRPGNHVELVDLCVRGARIYSRRPLHPGARVHLQLVASAKVVRLGAHVLRCAVAVIDSAGGVVYSAALKFDHRCELPWEERTHRGYQVPAGMHHNPQQEEQGIPVAPVPSKLRDGRS